MDKKPWLNNITVEDMPNDEIKFLAEFCGVETAVNLVENLRGVTINIPSDGFRRLKDKHILQNYDGSRSSILRLSLQCDVTDKYIYKLLKKNRNIISE